MLHTSVIAAPIDARGWLDGSHQADLSIAFPDLDYFQRPAPAPVAKQPKRYGIGAIAIVGTALAFWAPVIAYIV